MSCVLRRLLYNHRPVELEAAVVRSLFDVLLELRAIVETVLMVLLLMCGCG